MAQPKPAIASGVLWGLVAVVVPWLDQLYSVASQIPVTVLPPNVSLIVQGLGVALAAYSRLRGSQAPIKGVVKVPK